jgi:hypothetical protein
MATEPKQTQATLAHHLQSFGQKSVDGILSDYTEASLIMTPNGPLKGLVEVRKFFTTFIETLPEGFLGAFKILRQEVVGETAYIIWQAAPWVTFATDTFIVQDSKISIQTFAAYPLS